MKKSRECEEIAIKMIREMFKNGEGELNVKVWNRKKKEGTEIEWTVEGGPRYRGKEEKDGS